MKDTVRVQKNCFFIEHTSSFHYRTNMSREEVVDILDYRYGRGNYRIISEKKETWEYKRKDIYDEGRLVK